MRAEHSALLGTQSRSRHSARARQVPAASTSRLHSSFSSSTSAARSARRRPAAGSSAWCATVTIAAQSVPVTQHRCADATVGVRPPSSSCTTSRRDAFGRRLSREARPAAREQRRREAREPLQQASTSRSRRGVGRGAAPESGSTKPRTRRACAPMPRSARAPRRDPAAAERARLAATPARGTGRRRRRAPPAAGRDTC